MAPARGRIGFPAKSSDRSLFLPHSHEGIRTRNAATAEREGEGVLVTETIRCSAGVGLVSLIVG